MTAQTKAQLQSALDALQSENEFLTAEVARLTGELEQAQSTAPAAPALDVFRGEVTFFPTYHKFGVTKDGDTWVSITALGDDKVWRTFKAFSEDANIINNLMMGDDYTAQVVARPQSRTYQGRELVDYKITKITVGSAVAA